MAGDWYTMPQLNESDKGAQASLVVSFLECEGWKFVNPPFAAQSVGYAGRRRGPQRMGHPRCTGVSGLRRRGRLRSTHISTGRSACATRESGLRGDQIERPEQG